MKRRFYTKPRPPLSRPKKDDGPSGLLQKAGIYCSVLTGFIALLCGFFTCRLQIQSNELASNDSSQKAQINTLTAMMKEMRLHNLLLEEQSDQTKEISKISNSQLQTYHQQLELANKQLAIGTQERNYLSNEYVQRYNKDLFQLSDFLQSFYSIWSRHKMMRRSFPGIAWGSKDLDLDYSDAPTSYTQFFKDGKDTTITFKNIFEGKQLTEHEKRMYFIYVKPDLVTSFYKQTDSLISITNIKENSILLLSSLLSDFSTLSSLVKMRLYEGKSIRNRFTPPIFTNFQDFQTYEPLAEKSKYLENVENVYLRIVTEIFNIVKKGALNSSFVPAKD